MSGDDRRRFCASCKLHVHDLSAMTKMQALAFLQRVGQGHACVRLFRRADGTMLTRDCPVGVRQRMRRMIARAAALWVALATGLAACVRQSSGSLTNAPAVPTKSPEPSPRVLMGEMEMGDVASPPPTEGKPVQKPTENAPVEMGLVRPGGR